MNKRTVYAYYKTRNTRTWIYGILNIGITPEHWWNTGTLAEKWDTGRTIGIARNSGTCEEQRSNVTAKPHQEILPIQNEDILRR